MALHHSSELIHAIAGEIRKATVEPMIAHFGGPNWVASQQVIDNCSREARESAVLRRMDTSAEHGMTLTFAGCALRLGLPDVLMQMPGAVADERLRVPALLLGLHR